MMITTWSILWTQAKSNGNSGDVETPLRLDAGTSAGA